MKKNLVVFDVDGTLYKTDSVSVFAAQKALEDMNLEVLDGNIIRSYFGDKSDVFCRKIAPGIPASRLKELAEKIDVYELKYIPKTGELYDGVTEMLEELKSKDFILAICSYASREYVDVILKTFEIKHFFTYIKTYEEHTSKSEILGELLKKADYDMAVMVGDRFHDFDAAKANNIPSIGALYGYGDKEALLSDFPARSTCDVINRVIECSNLY